MTEEPYELAAYRRLQALAESRVRGVEDRAMTAVLARLRTAMVRETLKAVAAIERLPASKNRELALEQALCRASQVDYLRALIDEVGSLPQ